MYIDGATCRTAQYGRCRAVVCAEEGPLKIRLPNGTRFDSLQATCVSRGMSGVYGTDKFGLSTLLTGF